MVYDASNEIESIYIQANLDLKRAEQQLKDFQSSTYTIKAVVDDKQLTSLNSHLDLKQKHLKETVDFYRLNPIRVYTDQRELTSLNQSLTQLKSLSGQKISFAFDDREIVQGLKNISKQIQAQNFRLKLDNNDFGKQIQTALDKVSPNLSVNIKVKETASARTESKELTIGLKNIESAIYKTNAKKSVLGTISTGIFSGLGEMISKSIADGLKKDLGVNVNAIARPFTKFIAKPLSKITPESRQQFEDSMVGALEELFVFKNQDGYKSKLKNAFEPAINEIKQTVLEVVGSGLQVAAQPLRIRKRVMLAQSMVEARKMAEKIDVPDNADIQAAKSISFITGGIDFQKGGVNTKFAQNLVKRVLPGSYSVPVYNDYSNDEKNLGQLFKLTQQLTKTIGNKPMPLDMLLHTNVEKGYNPDSVKMAAQAIAYRKAHPEKPLVLGGTSGGSYVVEEAMAILERAGISNAKGIGITAPVNNLMSVAKKQNYKALVGEFDPLNVAMFGGSNVANKDHVIYKETEKQLPISLPGLLKESDLMTLIPKAGKGHNLLSFLANPEFQSNVQSFLGDSINPISKAYTGMRGEPALHYQRLKNDEEPTITRTLKAVFGDSNTLKQIKDNNYTGDKGYTFAVPQKVDWRRDNDFKSMIGNLPKEKSIGEDVKKEFAEYTEFLQTMEEGLSEFLDSGGKVKQKLFDSLEKGKQFYPELESIQEQVLKTFEEYSNLTNIDPKNDTRSAKQKYQDTSRLNRIQTQYPGLTANTKLEISNIKVPELQVDKIKTPDIQSTNLEIQKAEIQKTNLLSVEQAIEKSKQITSSFSDTYKSIKTDLKAGNIDFVDQSNIGANAKAAQLLEMVDKARQDITKMRSDAGIPKIGTTEASQINQTLGTLSTLEKNLQTSFKKAKLPIPEIKRIGEQINQGLGDGIENSNDEPIKAIKNVAESLIEETQEIFEIHSPSRVFQEIGQFIGEGLKLGIDSFATSDLFKSFKDGVSDFFGSIGLNIDDLLLSAGKLGLGFAAVVTGLPLVKDFVSSSLEVATEMENLNRQIVFASGNTQQGQQALQSIRTNAKDLKIDTRQALQGASGFLASTSNSSLEGQQSVEILENFNTLLATRSVDKDRQQRFNIALEQMASKGIQSEELRGQAAEAIPGFYQIFARSQGLSGAELSKKLKNTPGGLSPETLITASQQAKAESIIGLPEALDTSQAAINKLDNSVLELHEKVGNIFLPLQKLSFNVASSGLDVLSGNLELISKTTLILGLYLSRPLWKPFIEGALNAIKNIDLLALKSKSASFNISGIVNGLKPIAAELLIFQTAISAVDLLRISFTDLGGAATTFANQSEKGLKTVQQQFELANKTPGNNKTNKPYTYGIQQYLGDVFENPLALLNPFDNSKKEKDKAKRDTLDATKRGYDSGKELLNIVDSSTTQNNINQVVEYDKQLASIQSRRRALIQLNPEDKKGVQDLTKEEGLLVKARYESLKPLGSLQGQLEAQIRGLKDVKPLIESLNKDGRYDDQLIKIDEQITQLESKQNSLTKAIGKTTNAFDYWKKSIQESNILLLDTKTSIESISVSFKNTVSDLNLSGKLTPGNQQLSNNLIDINSLTKQQQAQYNNVNQNKASFSNGTDASNVLKNYKIGEDTGVNKINQIISQTENDNDKFILEQFATYQQSKIDLKNLGLQVSEAKNALFNSLKENTKAVAEYYQGVQRETAKVSIEFKDGLNQLDTLNQQSKIKAALTNVGDNIFTQFADGIIQNLQDLNDIKTGKNSIISKTQQAQFDIQDIVKSGIDLSKSVPGNLPKIPIQLDFTDINNDQNVELLNSNLTTTNDLTGLINQGNQDLNKILVDSANNVNGINSNFNQTVNQTNQFNSALEQTKTQATGINDIFGNIVNSIQGAANSALQLVANLATGNVSQLLTPGNLNKAGNFLQQGINFIKGQDISTKPYKIQESVGESIQNVGNYYDLEKHHPSSGQEPGRSYTNMLYPDINQSRLEEIRRAGDRILVKKDFILSQNGNQRVGVPSPINGYVKTSDNFGTAGIYQDPEFKTLLAQVLHLSDFAVKSGEYVKYGQSLGTQGGRGAGGNQNAFPIHSHVESDPTNFKKYIADLITGKFETETTSAINFVQSKFNNSTPGKSSNLLEFVKSKEGFSSTPYSDHGQLSIGYGTRAKSSNEVINPVEAEQRLSQELIQAQKVVLSSVKVKLEPNQLDALTSLAYNAGDLKQFPKLLGALNSGNFAEAQKQFLDINKASGSIQSGLTDRRRQEAAMFGGNPAMQASINGQFLPPGQLQGLIGSGITQSVSNKQALSQLDIAQTQKQNEIKANDLLRKNETALRTFRRGLRDSADTSRTDNEQIQDLRGNVNPIKDTVDSKALEIVKQQREFDGYIRDRERKLIDIDDQIKTANQLLQTGGLNNSQKQEIQKGLTQSIAEKTQAQKELTELRILKNDTIQTAKSVFNQQETFKNQKIVFDQTSQEISNLQAKVEGLKALQTFNPMDKQVQQIPDLEKIISLKQVDLETEKNILDVQEKVFNKTLSENQGNQQIEQLKQASVLKQEQIDLTYQEAKAQQELQNLSREFNTIQKERANNNDRIKEQLTSIELIQRRNPSDYSRGNALELTRNSQLSENQTAYENKKLDILSDKTISNKRISLLRNALLNNSRVNNIQGTYSSDLEQQKIKDIQNSNDRQNTVSDFVNTPGINLLNARASSITSNSGNEFKANALSRQAALLQENIRYQKELNDLDSQVAQMNFQGLDTSGLNQIRNDLEGIHKLNLDNVNVQFKTFGQTIESIGKQSLMGLSQSLTDLIIKGGSLGDVFDNLFNTVLSGVLNAGISSLLGGLFYDGGIVPNYAFGGSIVKGLKKERAESGRKPMLAIVHQGELLIPGDRVNQLANNGLSPEMLLGNFAKGGVVGSNESTSNMVNNKNSLNISYESTVINSQEYVSKDQFEKGLRQAAEAGAKGGEQRVTSKLSNSVNYRKSLGISS